MSPTHWTETLNRLSLGRFVEKFKELKAPPLNDALGSYRAFYVGPKWLRAVAPPSLAMTGFKGFWGKEFLPENRAINIFSKGGVLTKKLPAHLNEAASLIDGQPALAMTYSAGTPWPWTRATDEFRALDDQHLLGLGIIDLPLLKDVPFPFLLERDD